MSSKLKSKKSKTKRSVNTTCWVQNSDGTLSLTIGAKKSNNDSELNDITTNCEEDIEAAAFKDYNGNVTNDPMKIPQTVQNDVIQNELMSTAIQLPTTPNLPIKILKSNWLQTGVSYQEQQKIKRHGEMTAERLEMATIPPYTVPTAVWESLEKEEPLALNFSVELYRKKIQHYHKAFNTMIHLEEAANVKFMKTFDQTAVRIFYGGTGRIFFFLNEDRMAEISAAIEENLLDALRLKPVTTDESWLENYFGSIKGKDEEKIYIEMYEQSYAAFKKVYKNQPFDIFFRFNRLSYRMQHYALDLMRDHRLFNQLIDNPAYDDVKRPVAPTILNNFELSRDSMFQLNPEQESAVENIVHAKNYPLPYILIGPPGTGKTRTLVASIEQIVLLTSKNVLVCAQSNGACDEIAERLTAVLCEDELFRLYAKTFDVCKLNPLLVPYSNWTGQEFHYPSLKFLQKFRVLVCTLCTAGTLTRAGISANHFSYVFIDESASAFETMTLIPIAGLCTTVNKIHCSIILAGDPKQLDAVTKSEQAKELGFRTSFLERLCEHKLYQRNDGTTEFNGTYITQLIRNYRSHSSILKLPNELFYENTLIPIASEDVTGWFINSPLLPSKRFPIIFKSVQSYNVERSEVNKSLFNIMEVMAVIDFIKNLLSPSYNHFMKISQSDIGVVTPYKMQRRKIAQACHRLGFDDITIGTAEAFQGQEKPVMIVSTVRSGGNRLGFVNNARRFNVMITRAKCLLIIVGDPHSLQNDSNWNSLIEYCLDNNAMIQSIYRYP
ncbi:putative helicase mov-10-B.1 [Contarinia nasturtii]|uniref:putative helicase mov-10-B.1 n=1 Tax=Contarinia nasturtii TaxID=265458 RepID=UPI0012D43DFD|nr:putative helicase mov-10-B.1 [Contarinia nasturtii]